MAAPTAVMVKNVYDVWNDLMVNRQTLLNFTDYIGWKFEEWAAFYNSGGWNGPIPDRPLKFGEVDA